MDVKPHMGFWNNLPRPFSILAPMEDVTDWVFRTVVGKAGRPDVFFTEFTSAQGIVQRRRDALHRLPFARTHRPLVAQIWGTEPESFYGAAIYLKNLGVDGIDINMGCPQPKIVKRGACAALIRNPSLATEIVQATQEGAASGIGSPIPVSIKTRTGWSSVQTESWLAALLAMKPAVLSLHARTAEQQSEGVADWNQVRAAVALRDELSPETLVVGNGDILSAVEGLSRVSETGCDGIMVGRGVFADLFIFRQFAKLRAFFGSSAQVIDASYSDPESSDSPRCFDDLDARGRIGWALWHLGLYEDYWGEARNYQIMKKFFKVYLKRFDGADTLRDEIMLTTDHKGARNILGAFAPGQKVPETVNG